jgi:hypothetical protein
MYFRIKKWQNEEDARVKLLYEVYDDRAKALKHKRLNLNLDD